MGTENVDRILSKMAGKIDLTKRNDLVLVDLKNIGLRDRGHLYLARFYFDATRGIPTRLSIQDAVTATFGPTVVADPKEMYAGRTSIQAKLVSKQLLDTEAKPQPQYFAGIRQAKAEDVPRIIVEPGDTVRVMYQGRLLEGRASSVSETMVSVDVPGYGIIAVPWEQVVGLVQIPANAVRDEQAYDYFIQVFPEYYTRELTAR